MCNYNFNNATVLMACEDNIFIPNPIMFTSFFLHIFSLDIDWINSISSVNLKKRQSSCSFLYLCCV